MVENKVRSARFAPDIQEKIEAYQSVFGWDFGQTVTQLFNYRQRIQNVLSRFEVVRGEQGGTMIFYEHAEGEQEPLNDSAACYWLVQELQKSIAEGFREHFECAGEGDEP